MKSDTEVELRIIQPFQSDESELFDTEVAQAIVSRKKRRNRIEAETLKFRSC